MIFGKFTLHISSLIRHVLSRMANRKILELEATLKDTTSLAENTTEVTNLKISLNRAVTRLDEESSRAKNQIDELQKRLDHSGKTNFVFSQESISISCRKKTHRKRYYYCNKGSRNQCNGRTLCSIFRKS